MRRRAGRDGGGLNTKQTIFVNEYLKCWNASEAARRAGYNGKSNVIGARLLADVSIKEEIQRRVDEIKMSADEALIRLAEQARGDMADFLKFEDGVSLPFLDLKGANEKGLLRLVKKFKYNSDGKPEIELYDAQAALVHIGKAHGLFNNDPGSSEDKPFYVAKIKEIVVNRESVDDSE